MGILGYPNMDDNNHDGIFGDYSDIYSNFSTEGEGMNNTGSDTDEVSVNNKAETLSSESVIQEEVSEIPGQNFAPQKKSGSGRIYFLVLLLLFVAAAGLFYYKKNMAPDSNISQEQTMGDYFYDQATGSGDSVSPQDTATTTVDVDLTASADSQADNKSIQANNNSTAKPEQEEKALNAIEKAELKKKQDAQKENQIGLSSNSVIIPVSAGGRSDPFVPYNQQQAISRVPKFEMIAPPTVIPDADPVIDELVETKISGIMYDPARPSAIVNFGGTDQLVHKGDVVKGYKILNITKNCVVIKYKANIYQATVGQSLNDGINLNPVSNLSKSFGGSYSKSPSNIIQFNN